MDLTNILKVINGIKNVFILIAVSGIIFALFALIYNEEYIKIGLLTFAYGVIADRSNNAFWKLYCEPNNKLIPLFVLDFVLMIVWIYFAFCLFPI